MKKTIIILFILIIFKALVFSENNTQWIRYCSISPQGDKIVFSFKGDLYIVNVQGGEPKLLTRHNALDSYPVWSKDGNKIAFASNRYGNFDIFVINSNGGKSQRLTYHSADEFPYSFNHDNENIIFSACRLDNHMHRQYPSSSFAETYTVPVNGGRVGQLWTIPAEEIRVNKKGNLFLYQDIKGGENYWRKHHTSSVCRDIWIYNKITNEHTQLSNFKGENRNPNFSPDENKIFYLSEESGNFNVWEMEIKNPQIKKQITFLKNHPVRFLTVANNGTLCFSHNGNLYIKESGKEKKLININICNDNQHNNEKLLLSKNKVDEMSVSPNGKELAFIIRGEIFATSVEGKMNKRITNTVAQEKFINFSPNGKEIIYAGERDSKWGIYKSYKINKKEPYFFASTIIKEEPILVNENDNYQPLISPDGKKLAYIENRRNLKILDLKTKKTRTILSDKELFYMSDGDQYFRWSPDSKYLLVEYNQSISNSEVFLVKADGTKKMNLTQSGYSDYKPKWENNGKQIIWFSTKNGLRSHANSGRKQADVYSIFLTKEDWDIFKMSKDEYSLYKEIKDKQEEKKKNKDKSDKKDDKKKKEKSQENIKIDFKGIRDRKVRLTIHSSKLSDAVLSKDGEELYYLTSFEKGINLWSTNLRTKSTKILIKLSGSYGKLMWDKEKKNLFLLSKGKISKLDTKAKKIKPIYINGEINLNENYEREQMFNHVWKRTASMFYITGYHGANWNALKDNYKQKLTSINNNRDFAELLSEMLGELNVSHCGARVKEYNPQGDKTASLGIFFDYNYLKDGLKIEEVIEHGPLDRASFNIKKGMIIKKINGKKITVDFDYAKLLNRKANIFCAIDIYNPTDKKEFQITVKPISLKKLKYLLYKRWVKINEKEVEKLSNGEIGYIHIPGMNDSAYREAYDKVMGKFDNCKSLIVDTRFNRGGDLVGDITMFLTGKQFITYAIEKRDLGNEPTYRWTKPSVALVNEANYSDGHCFACAYKDLKIGKIIGMPVPGTCSFAGWEMLQNGKILWGSIPVSAKNMAGEWLENNQTEPDIKVKNIPGKIDKGVDEQLLTAINELLKK